MTTLTLLTPGLPALAMLLLVLPYLAGRPLPERRIAAAATAFALLSTGTSVGLLLGWAVGGPVQVPLGVWYRAGDYEMPLVAAIDGLSVAASLTVSVVGLIVLRFSTAYLHNEPGHLRFFATTLMALASLQVVVLAGTLDLLFFGWELLGLCSFLLIAFFHERRQPVRRALRALFTYRIGDLGLLVAAVLLHHLGHGTALGPAATALSGGSADLVGLLLLLTAIGKSALVPATGWLSRSMEGPTPSSALFYGALSVNAGVYLLLRSWPIYGDAPLARAGLVVVGLATAAVSSASARVRTDVKGAIVLGGSAQIGLVVAEIGLGLTTIAAAHAAANIGLRLWQLLRAPSALHIAHRRAGLRGIDPPPPPEVPAWLFALSARLFRLDDLVEGLLVSPLVKLGHWLDRWERRVEARVVGDRDRTTEGRIR